MYLQFINEERFWSMVDKDGPTPEHRPELGQCWIWKGSMFQNGYGRYFISKKIRPRTGLAHRIAYQLRHGEIPDEVKVCHHCDNKACVRDEHHFIGSQKDNMQDMIAKGRQARGEAKARHGENHGRAKLTWPLVREIRKQTGFQGQIATRYNVSRSLVGQILRHEIWKEY